MVGKNISKFRKMKNMTQEELAQSLNVTRQAVSGWENDRTQPDTEMLKNISEILEVSVEELIYGASYYDKDKKKKTKIIYQNNETINKGVSFGTVLAMVLSYAKWQSIGWAILHGLLNWIYVIYYIIKYGWS